MDHNITNYPVYQNHLAMSQYLLDVKPSDNGAVYKCKASNNATSSPLVAQVRLSVNCESAMVLLLLKSVPTCWGNNICVGMTQNEWSCPGKCFTFRNVLKMKIQS